MERGMALFGIQCFKNCFSVSQSHEMRLEKCSAELRSQKSLSCFQPCRPPLPHPLRAEGQENKLLQPAACHRPRQGSRDSGSSVRTFRVSVTSTCYCQEGTCST